ncbi:hypothetical protein EDC04DRAFT_2622934 [Pisolithus marmoratus]|nr:hypothetical protein EDC04DRAFT_2622934 [Pisolithus marmoratus]
MEDIQPNEHRLSRKGSERVPTVRSSHRGTYWRGYRGRGHTPRTSDYNPSRPSRPWRTPTPSRQHLAAQSPPRCPSRERYSYGQDVPGSSDQAGIATHFEQLPKRAKVGSVDAPPVDCQQDFSSLGKLRRNPGGIPGGSQQIHNSTKQTELPERDSSHPRIITRFAAAEKTTVCVEPYTVQPVGPIETTISTRNRLTRLNAYHQEFNRSMVHPKLPSSWRHVILVNGD